MPRDPSLGYCSRNSGYCSREGECVGVTVVSRTRINGAARRARSRRRPLGRPAGSTPSTPRWGVDSLGAELWRTPSSRSARGQVQRVQRTQAVEGAADAAAAAAASGGREGTNTGDQRSIFEAGARLPGERPSQRAATAYAWASCRVTLRQRGLMREDHASSGDRGRRQRRAARCPPRALAHSGQPQSQGGGIGRRRAQRPGKMTWNGQRAACQPCVLQIAAMPISTHAAPLACSLGGGVSDKQPSPALTTYHLTHVSWSDDHVESRRDCELTGCRHCNAIDDAKHGPAAY